MSQNLNHWACGHSLTLEFIHAKRLERILAISCHSLYVYKEGPLNIEMNLNTLSLMLRLACQNWKSTKFINCSTVKQSINNLF
jgi:hypothetical protein